MTVGESLVIRADADVRMGTGHVMRCLALAQAWEEQGGRAVFLASHITPALEARLRDQGFSLRPLRATAGSAEDAGATLAAARDARATWIVVDGYQFDAAYQRAITAGAHRLLVIDDFGHAEHYSADLVLNQNVHAAESLYRNRNPSTRLLLGTRYAMLRREFWACQGWRRRILKTAGQLLVTLGGSDPDNVTGKIIEAVDRLESTELETTVVVGGSNPHRRLLEDAVRHARHAIHLRADVTDMPKWMMQADLAVTAAGGTLWELAFLGVPSVTIVTAENQEPAARWLAERNVFPTLGWAKNVSVDAICDQLRSLLESPERRQEHSQRAAALIDGRGAFRVVEAMQIPPPSQEGYGEGERSMDVTI